MSRPNRKKRYAPKNRFARSSKYSEYKTLQLLECFARDLSVQDGARLTKMTERTVRDRYADIRAKILPWCLKEPNLFNGFGHLLLDPDGTINLHVLEALVYYSKSPAFKDRMTKRYPKFRTDKDPALYHVIEMAVRRFTSVDIPETGADFTELVKRVFTSAQSESVFTGFAYNLSVRNARLTYWKSAARQLGDADFKVRTFPGETGVTLFRDFKLILKWEPL